MHEADWFRLLDDIHYPNRWQLNEPQSMGAGEEVDGWEFTMASRWERSTRLVAVADPGVPLDFTLGALGVPFATPALADVILEAAGKDVQLVPVTVGGRELSILNVLRTAACLDETRSEFVRWTTADGRRDRVGQYRMVPRLQLDAARAGAEGMLRITGWDVPLIVSGSVKQAIEAGGFSGPVFEPVT